MQCTATGLSVRTFCSNRRIALWVLQRPIFSDITIYWKWFYTGNTDRQRNCKKLSSQGISTQTSFCILTPLPCLITCAKYYLTYPKIICKQVPRAEILVTARYKKMMRLKKSSVIPSLRCRIKYCDTSANLPQCGAFTLWPWHVINHTFCMATGPGILQPTPLNQCSQSEWMACLGNTYYKHKNATPGRLEDFYHWNLKSCLFLPTYCMSVFISYFYCCNINCALLSSEEWFSR